MQQARVLHDPIMNENAGLGPLPYSTTTHSHIVSPVNLRASVADPDHKVAGVNRSQRHCFFFFASQSFQFLIQWSRLVSPRLISAEYTSSLPYVVAGILQFIELTLFDAARM
jgi:hypothetical protein